MTDLEKYKAWKKRYMAQLYVKSQMIHDAYMAGLHEGRKEKKE